MEYRIVLINLKDREKEAREDTLWNLKEKN